MLNKMFVECIIGCVDSVFCRKKCADSEFVSVKEIECMIRKLWVF